MIDTCAVPSTSSIASLVSDIQFTRVHRCLGWNFGLFRMPSVTWSSSVLVLGAFIIGAYVIFGGPGEIRIKKKRKKDCIPGLTNIGNSCFLNALVQALASCPSFISWLKNKHKSSSPPLVSALCNLLKVLNNEGNNSGDACAGEVLSALRGHGWVISTEEQDAHEFFHALTATVDDELASTTVMTSLLDISWMEKGNTNVVFPMLNSGVLIRSDCWRQSNDGDCHLHFHSNEDAGPGISKVINTYAIVKELGDVVPTTKVNSECIAIIDPVNSVCENNGTVYGLPDINVNNIEDSNLLDQISNTKEAVQILESSDNESGHEVIDIRSEVNNLPVTSTSHCSDTVKNIVEEEVAVGSVSNIERSLVNDVSLECSTSKHNIIVTVAENLVNGCSTYDSSEKRPVDETSGNNAGVKVNLEKYKSCFNICKTNIRERGEITVVNEDKGQESHISWKIDNQDSPFRGYLVSQLQCTLCGFRNPAQWSSFESLSLSLPSLPWGDITLQGLLDSYITQEKVTDVTCDDCTKRACSNIKTTFTKQLTIGKLPNCLCFHIKRTVWMDNGSAMKRQDHVVFPEFLTMDPYTYITSLSGGKEASIVSANINSISRNIHSSSSDGSSAPSPKNESSLVFRVGRLRCEHLYRLKAVIVHVGDAFRGHFVTYRRGALCTSTRNKWFYTSDLNIRETCLDDMKKANAYMILYEKVSE
ncbi:Ubiquitin carboxyl-terminal hydrolase 30 [Halocaridina rubra]|uniref:Ubiquitin carboxyl-terminal hydrolase n=1 Tax=Halocaridina rubra TaxID=373956 RepID=A0AAN8ZNK1_HALRR